MNARGREFLFLREHATRNLNQSRAMYDLARSLPKATPPEGGSPWEWKKWRAMVKVGIWRIPAAYLKKTFSDLLDRARMIEGRLASERTKMYLQWMRRAAPQGEASVYRWIREKPPFVSAPIGEGNGIIPFKEACIKKARIFTDIWETELGPQFGTLQG